MNDNAMVYGGPPPPVSAYAGPAPDPMIPPLLTFPMSTPLTFSVDVTRLMTEVLDLGKRVAQLEADVAVLKSALAKRRGNRKERP